MYNLILQEGEIEMEEFLANINGPIGQMSVGNFILLMVSLLLLFKNRSKP